MPARRTTRRTARRTAPKRSASRSARRSAPKRSPRRSAPKRSARRSARRSAPKRSARRSARRSAPKRSARRSTPKRSARRSAPKRSARRSAPKRSARRSAPKRSARRYADKAPPIPKNIRGRKVKQADFDTAVSDILRAPVGDKKDIDSFLAGIESTEKSGPYDLDKVFKEDEKGYKGQRVNVKDEFVRASPKKKSSKKGKSPYNIFVAEQSPIIRAENPGLKQPEIMKLIGAEWKKQKKN